MQFIKKLECYDEWENPNGFEIEDKLFNSQIDNIKNETQIIIDVNELLLEFINKSTFLNLTSVNNDYFTKIINEIFNCDVKCLGYVEKNKEIEPVNSFYVVKDINDIENIINIELLCSIFKSVYLIRLYSQNPYDYECFVVCLTPGNINNNKFIVAKTGFDNKNLTNIFDFAIVWYSWVKYIFSLGLSVLNSDLDMNNNKIDLIEITPEEEFKLYIKRINEAAKKI